MPDFDVEIDLLFFSFPWEGEAGEGGVGGGDSPGKTVISSVYNQPKNLWKSIFLCIFLISRMKVS